MLLQRSLKKLITNSKATSMRLWGKIKGTEQDYYIAEGTLDAVEGEGDDGAANPDNEARGQGVN